jgi:hypothetical protein
LKIKTKETNVAATEMEAEQDCDRIKSSHDDLDEEIKQVVQWVLTRCQLEPEHSYSMVIRKPDNEEGAYNIVISRSDSSCFLKIKVVLKLGPDGKKTVHAA